VTLPNPNIEPLLGAELTPQVLKSILGQIQENFDALDTGSVKPREIIARVSSAGVIGAGSGFTVTHSATGVYVLTFKRAFAQAPGVVASPFVGEAAASIQAHSTASAATIYLLGPGGSTLVNAGFTAFIRAAV